MAKQSSVNLDITNNADGFDISGGTTVRKLGITGGDVTIAGSGSATVTFPTTSTTIAGLGITQSFSALQSFSAGISAAGGVTLSGTLQGTTANFTGLVSSTVGFSGSGTNLKNIVTTFNGLSGAVTGVASIRGLTGTVGITNGTGIGLSVSGQTMTFSNTGVLSIDGSTGAITNVARTNVNNNFSAAQTVTGAITSYDLGTDHSIILIPSTDRIRFYDAGFGNSLELYAGGNLNNQVIAFPDSNTTLAGLAGTQTFTGTNTFTPVTNFASGISAAGGVTFSGNFSGATGSFSRLLTVSAGISAAGGVTLSGTLQGTTANFTGLVSSTVGFSGPGTNITGVVTSFNNQTGAVTGVTVGGTNVFTALNSFNAGISAAGATFSGYVSGSTGFRFGFPTGASGYIQYVPAAYPSGGLLLTGSQIFQIGGSNVSSGQGFLNVDPNAEKMIFNGRTEMYVNQGYQSTVSPFSIAIGTAQTGQPIRIAKQTTSGSIDTAQLIAGCDSNGIWYGLGFSGGTGGIRSSGGFTFGSPSGTTFMVFVPQTSCSNGGLWIRDGNFQIGGSALSAASGSFFYSPCGERFDVYGYATFNNSYNYQAGRAVLRLNGAPTQSVPILAAYKQTSDGTQLTNTFTTTNMVAGIDQNGALFSSVGISAGGGVTFAGTLKGVTASFTGLLSASSGISASGATFSGSVSTDNIFSIDSQLSLNDKANNRVSIGDYSSNANSTFIYLRDNISSIQISNPFGVISLGDPTNIDNGNYISYDAPNARLSGNEQNNLGGFLTIEASTTILENNRRVTTNARSWFL